MTSWRSCKRILVVRPDNMGDLIMSGPAIRALKESFACRIILLTSAQAAIVADFMGDIDEVVVAELPWVTNSAVMDNAVFNVLCSTLREGAYDGAVIFSVYSQSVLPTALLLQMAGIPLRLAYCRENPYQLLTHWVPDPEPYSFIRHQVRRDLHLVESIGASCTNDHLQLTVDESVTGGLNAKLIEAGVDLNRPPIIVHTGVSEKKREYPMDRWKQVLTELSKQHQVLLTGSAAESGRIDDELKPLPAGAFNVAGLLSLPEFIQQINRSSLVITVNTSTAHIAAALSKSILVLYALTNPQHLPWKASGTALYYRVAGELRSRNEVIRYVDDHLHPPFDLPSPALVISKARALLADPQAFRIPELVPLRTIY